jgi:hypothetical protein
MLTDNVFTTAGAAVMKSATLEEVFRLNPYKHLHKRATWDRVATKLWGIKREETHTETLRSMNEVQLC